MGLEKDVQDYLLRSCEEWSSII